MPDISKYVPLLVVICIGIVAQVLLIPLDCINKPYKTAVAFTDRQKALDFEVHLKSPSGRAFTKKRL